MIGVQESVSSCPVTLLIIPDQDSDSNFIQILCMWVTVWIKNHLIIDKEQLQKQKKTDQATVTNTMVNTLMLHRRKEKKITCPAYTHTHTHKYFQIL